MRLRAVLCLLGLGVALIQGCASAVPQSIRVPPPGNPTHTDVYGAPERYLGARVRWGGSIAGIRNRPNETRVEIVARRLDREGEPVDDDRSSGRFIAVIPLFLDPLIFKTGRALTVAGVVGDPVTGTIGEHPYRFPLLRVDSYYLWEELPDPRYYYDGPYYRYGPWHPYPHHPYPYW